MKIKEDFHHLIDNIEDEQLLRHYYQLIQKINDGHNGRFWNGLYDDEKEELLLAYEESFDSNILLRHQQVKQQHAKWLKP